MSPNLVLLGWHEPWVDLFADWLWLHPELLRRRLVVVPTRESGRRLRERLLGRAIRNGSGALLGPRLATPEDFFTPDFLMPDSVRWAGWVQVLRATKDFAVETLFPTGVTQRDDGWRCGVARQMEQAREWLASVNLNFKQVAEQLPGEANRWLELVILESRVISQWDKWGFRDPVGAKKERAYHPLSLPGVEEVIIAGVADPTGLAVEAWQRLLKQGTPFTVLVGAPDTLQQAFDAWGRPQSEFWADRNQHITPEPTEIRVAADANGLAEAVARACEQKTNQEVTLGLCDPAFAPAVAYRFQEAGWTTFEPQGIPLAKDGWPELLEAMANALESPQDHAALVRFAQHPKVWRERLEPTGAWAVFAALERWEKKNGASDATATLAKLSSEKIGAELREAGRLLQQAQGLIHEIHLGKVGVLEKQLHEWLQRDFPTLSPVMNAELAGWKCLDGRQFVLPLRLRWLAHSLTSLRWHPDQSEAALPLQGWLELPYDPAPHLILAGLHEGCVPEIPAANPLLTEVVREKLGLRDRQSRLAREVFLYTALVEARRAKGTVTVVTAQTDPQGDPCKPSRILLHDKPEGLPKRVLILIKDKPDMPLQPTPPWARGDWQWRLLPEAKPNKTWDHLSPSMLKAYLECPTRFYFNKVLGWEEFQPFEQELDGAGFGDLLHAVFYRWASDKEACECAKANDLKACWLGLLRQQVADQFGTELPPLLQLQILSAEERLTALAEKQAQQRQQGWHVVEFEKEFPEALKLAGLPLKLRVDRIDRHEDGRQVRIIDYKTGKKALEPRKAHLQVWTKEGCAPPCGPLVPIRGRDYGWVDLQLPLYAYIVGKEMKLESLPLTCYAVIPEAVNDTDFKNFEGLEEIIDCAMEWAEQAAQRIIDGVFWPPLSKYTYQSDPYAVIAPEGLAKALGNEWATFLGGKSQAPGGTAS